MPVVQEQWFERGRTIVNLEFARIGEKTYRVEAFYWQDRKFRKAKVHAMTCSVDHAQMVYQNHRDSYAAMYPMIQEPENEVMRDLLLSMETTEEDVEEDVRGED